MPECDLIEGEKPPFDVICRIAQPYPQSKLSVTYPHHRMKKGGKAADTQTACLRRLFQWQGNRQKPDPADRFHDPADIGIQKILPFRRMGNMFPGSKDQIMDTQPASCLPVIRLFPG